MKIADSRVKKCKDITIIIDKKMRQRKIEMERFIIPLNDNNPFQVYDFVKIISKDDFEKLGSYIKALKHEKNLLNDKVKELHVKLEMQMNYIEKLESEANNGENKGKGLFKNLLN
jgi:predicted  nucleic acid-binding Zn-ribbon protein